MGLSRRLLAVPFTATALALLSGAGCGELEELDVDRCGNEAIEANEDCDTFVSNDVTQACIRPGAVGQCHYSCAPRNETERFNCPVGYGCGKDDVCRRSSGHAGKRQSTGSPAGRWLATADLDGNQDDDILGVSTTHLSVDFYQDGVPLDSKRMSLVSTGFPSIGHANHDTLLDVVLPTEQGLAALLGSSGRDLSLVAHASLSVVITEFDFAGINLIPEVVDIGGETRRFAGDEPIVITTLGLIPVDDDIFYPALADDDAVKIAPSDILGRPIVARIDEVADAHAPVASGPTFYESEEQVVLAIDGSDEIQIFRPTYFWEPTMETVAYSPDPRAELGVSTTDYPTLPTSTTVVAQTGSFASRVFVTHANAVTASGRSGIPCLMTDAAADLHLDLVVENGSGGILVAFGLGDGTFHDDPCELEDVAAQLITPSSMAAPLSDYGACRDIIAAGDIDGDGALDIVSASGVHLSGLASTTNDVCADVTLVSPGPDTTWTAAVLGDFTGDDQMDVLAGGEEAGLDLLASNGGPFLNHAKLSTLGRVQGLFTGDFDGNGVLDAAIQENRGDVTAIGVMFGESHAVPLDPIDAAEITNMRGAAVANTVKPNEDFVDAADDIYISSQRSDIVFEAVILRGSADRLLQAPYTFFFDAEQAGMISSRLAPRGAAIENFDVGCPDTDAGVPAPAMFMAGEPLAGSEIVAGMAVACATEAGSFSAQGSAVTPLTPPNLDSAAHLIVSSVKLNETLAPIVMTWNRGAEDSARHIALSAPEVTGTGEELVIAEPEWAVIADAVPMGVPATSLGATTKSELRNWSETVSSYPQACRLTSADTQSLLFIALHDDGACEGDDPGATSRLHMIDADTLLGIRSGGSLDGASELTLDDDKSILSFACFNADDDAAEEIALLVVDGPLLGCSGGKTSDLIAQVLIVDVADDGTTSIRPDPYVTLDETTVSLLSSPVGQQAPVTGIARGDFDGDGVDDLAVGAVNDTFLWLGRATNP